MRNGKTLRQETRHSAGNQTCAKVYPVQAWARGIGWVIGWSFYLDGDSWRLWLWTKEHQSLDDPTSKGPGACCLVRRSKKHHRPTSSPDSRTHRRANWPKQTNKSSNSHCRSSVATWDLRWLGPSRCKSSIRHTRHHQLAPKIQSTLGCHTRLVPQATSHPSTIALRLPY